MDDGLSSERTLGKPSNWKGDEAGWNQFSEKFVNWIGGLPGDVELLLEGAAKEPQMVSLAKLSPRQRVMANGIMRALKALIEGKAMDIVNCVAERTNGFEAWRLLHVEYKLRLAGRMLVSIEEVMESCPKPGQDFSEWWYSFLQLIEGCERTRQKPLDDDIKCAVALKRSPQALRDHLILSTKHQQ